MVLAIIRRDPAGAPAEVIDGAAYIFAQAANGAERTVFKSMRKQNARATWQLHGLARVLRVTLAALDAVATGQADLEVRLHTSEVVKGTDRLHLRDHGLISAMTIGDWYKLIMHIATKRGQRLTRGLKESEYEKEKKAPNRPKEPRTQSKRWLIWAKNWASTGP